jgi:hypothetical protein
MKKNKNLLMILGAGALAYFLFMRKKETAPEQPQLSKINPKVFNPKPTSIVRSGINVRRAAVDGVIY